MIEQQTESIKHLAKPVVEALEKVTERKCPTCKGVGEYIVNVGGLGIENSEPCTEYCPTCSGTGKVKWKWEPKWGDKVICDNRKFIYCGISPYDSIEGDFIEDNGDQYYMDFEDIIPILHWEKIERVLEGMGYVFQEPIRRCYGSESFKCHCVIEKNGKRIGWAWGNTRQEAVMQAVINLGDKLA